MRFKSRFLPILIILGLVVLFYRMHSQRTPEPARQTSGEESNQAMESPAAEAVERLPAPTAASATVPGPTPTSRSPQVGVVDGASSAPADDGHRLLRGFEKMPVDPQKERLILSSRVSNRAKELFLSGIAFSENLRKLRPEEVGELGPRLGEAIQKDQESFLAGIKTLTEEPLPKDLREDLVGLSVYLKPEDSSEMRTLAARQIQDSIASGNLSNGETRKEIFDGILATVKMSKDVPSGWAQVESLIDPNDPIQSEVVRTARKIIQLTPGAPAGAPIPTGRR